jgi:integrase
VTYRARGTGSVTQLPNGKWRGAVEIGYTATGGRRRIAVSATTRKECERLLRDKLREIATAGPPAAGANVTLKKWAEEWLHRQEARVRPKTWLGYRTCVNKWIIPTIGRTPLGKLTPGAIRALTAAVVRAGNNSTTARGVHIVLNKMLKDAQREGYTIPAPALMVELPRLATNDRTAIPPADCLKLLDVAVRRPDAARWIIAFLYGLREGEVLGLEWERIDGDAIDVSWQLQTVPWADRKARNYRIPDGYEIRPQHGTLCLVRPKSLKGKRLLPMFDPVAAALPPRSTGLVFTSDKGRPVTAHADEDAWHAIQDAAEVRHPSGRRYFLHEIRHSTATLLGAMGVPMEVRMKILGHSVMETTMNYTHADLTQMRAALGKAAERLELGGG